MEFIDFKNSLFERWQKRLLCICAWGTAVVFIVEVGIFFLLKSNSLMLSNVNNYLILRIIVPTTLNLTATAFFAFCLKKRFLNIKQKNYVAAITTFVISSTIAIFHNHYKFLLVATGLPILLSSIFANRKLLRMLLGLCFMTLTTAVFMMSFDPVPINPNYIFATTVCAIIYIVFTYCIANAILNSQSEQLAFMLSFTKKQIALIKDLKIEPLTKVYNRVAFKEASRIFVKKFNQGLITPHLVVINMDLFKKINDDYGHSNGDKVLIAFGEIIKFNMNGIRRAFRFSGDVFVLLFEKDSTEQVSEKISEIRQDLANMTFDFAKDLKFSFSAGIAKLHESWDENTWFNAADLAVYKAKTSGRNIVVDYDSIPSSVSFS